MDPAKTDIKVDINGKIWVTTILPNGKGVKIKYENILHLPNLSVKGIKGLSPIQVARETLGIQKASQKYVGSFYKTGTSARGVLTVPGVTLNKEAKEVVREEWESFNSGMTNANRIAILDSGITYQNITMSQQDAQFIETQKFNLQEIARIYNVPVHMVGDLERSTFSNIEQQSLSFVKNTMQPLITSWEQMLDYQLFTKEEQKRYYTKYNLSSELRGDSESRAKYYKEMIYMGAMNINEVRELEDRDSIPNGDKHFANLNYIFLEFMEEYQRLKVTQEQNKKRGGNDE